MIRIAQALKICSETPLLDARFFWEFHKGQPSESEVSDFIERRRQGEPVSKIIGRRGFWKRDFIVSCDVLDPRPDSETLIETVLRFYPDRTKNYRILDIGTGSGCLLLSLLDEYSQAQGVGIDKSEKALCIAQQNDVHKRACFCQADFTDKSFGTTLGEFDIIVSNPPYIPTNDIESLDKAVRCYDPVLALDGGLDGLTAYRQLSCHLSRLMKSNTLAFFEIGQGQEKDVIHLMEEKGYQCIEQVRDLGQIIRVLVFQ